MKIKSKLLFGFSSLIVIIVFLGVLTNSQSNLMTDDFRHMAERDLLVIQNAEKLLQLVSHAERDQVGFMSTGDESFLHHYPMAVDEFYSLIEIEKQLVSDNPAHVEKLERISELFTTWIDSVATPQIELGQQIYQNQNKDLELLLSEDDEEPILNEIYQIISILKENLRDGDHLDEFLLLSKIESDIQNSVTSQHAYLSTGNNEFFVSFNNLKIEFHENSQNLQHQLIDDEENLQLIYSIDKLYRKWDQEVVYPKISSRQLIDTQSGLSQISLLLKEGTNTSLHEEIESIFSEFIKTEEKLTDQRIKDALYSQDLTRYVIAVLLVASVTIAVVMGVSIFYSVLTPLSKLEKVAQKLKQGDYNEKIDIDSNDELGDFSRTFEMIRTVLIKKEKLKNIGELATRLAHDLRNPLTVVNGAIALIKRDLQNKDKTLDKRFVMIDAAIARMTHQIDDVMDFVRVSELQIETNSLLKLLKSSVSRTIKNKSVVIELPVNDIKLRCDANKLDIVFVNLLSNAVDAIKENGKIKIRLFDEPSYVKMEFEDSGPPIPADVLKEMFEPLFTTKQVGTGLGLASCKNIIEQHHGEISIKTNPTVITLTLSKNL